VYDAYLSVITLPKTSLYRFGRRRPGYGHRCSYMCPACVGCSRLRHNKMRSIATEVIKLMTYFSFRLQFYLSLIFKPFRNNRDSLKSENLSVPNKYSFSRRGVPGPPKTMPPFPSMHGYVEQNEYDYCEIDNLRGEDNPMKVTAR
jgi:hypothetical protein